MRGDYAIYIDADSIAWLVPRRLAEPSSRRARSTVRARSQALSASAPRTPALVAVSASAALMEPRRRARSVPVQMQSDEVFKVSITKDVSSETVGLAVTIEFVELRVSKVEEE